MIASGYDPKGNVVAMGESFEKTIAWAIGSLLLLFKSRLKYLMIRFVLKTSCQISWNMSAVVITAARKTMKLGFSAC